VQGEAHLKQGPVPEYRVGRRHWGRRGGEGGVFPQKKKAAEQRTGAVSKGVLHSFAQFFQTTRARFCPLRCLPKPKYHLLPTTIW
jgi:hypothetical protein